MNLVFLGAEIRILSTENAACVSLSICQDQGFLWQLSLREVPNKCWPSSASQALKTERGSRVSWGFLSTGWRYVAPQLGPTVRASLWGGCPGCEAVRSMGARSRATS